MKSKVQAVLLPLAWFLPARGAGCLSSFPLGPCISLGSFSVLYSLPEPKTMPVSAGGIST